ncbi:MAG: hypothetical protein ABL893_10870 [Hyphomicrobium sp.]|nr:hypothetical protein [Hyphomicrobium sp.]
MMRVKAYHGTTRTSADAILAGNFQPSKSPEEWLGTGIYFFEASETLAWTYARKAVREAVREKGEIDAVPAILIADIDLVDCLDMFEQSWNAAIANVVIQLEKAGELPSQHGLRLVTARGAKIIVGDVDMPPETFRKTFADFKVMNALWDYLQEDGFIARSIRAPFSFGRQHCLNSYLFNQSHVQIAVKDPSVIHDLRVRL